MFTSCAPRLIRPFTISSSARATSFQKFSRVAATNLNPRCPAGSPPVFIRSFGSTTPSLRNDDENAVVHVSIQEARDTTAKALQNLGWDAEDAALQAEIMTSAELCGNNQGLVKMYHDGTRRHLMAPDAMAQKPTVERDTPSSAVINGQQSPGMLAAVTAADMAVQKVASSDTVNIAVVAAYNTSTSSGQLGYYVSRMAEQGYVGIAMCNSPEFVAAAPGGKGVFGTNPIAVGVPMSHGKPPFMFDMATSAIALYGVLTSKAKGEPLPEGVAYAPDGSWTTDAAMALEGGAIATFGGHKGAGLSLVVELLAGGMTGGAVLGQIESKKTAKNWGHLFIAIKPDALVDDFPSKVESIIEAVKQSGTGIRIPGERSNLTALERKEAGVLPIPTKIWESILETASRK
mmetsp:Transcript_3877/g.7473  ORF Transcript_3877/g.7473 Transcript_3877/m.7473 type:complete len:403 (+) Transcript_3877:78-1286(+)